MLQAHESVIVSRDNIAGLFAHEVTRVFHDRLICPEDRLLFYQFLSDNLHDYFKVGNLVTKLGSICIKLKLEWDKNNYKEISQSTCTNVAKWKSLCKQIRDEWNGKKKS